MTSDILWYITATWDGKFQSLWDRVLHSKERSHTIIKRKTLDNVFFSNWIYLQRSKYHYGNTFRKLQKPLSKYVPFYKREFRDYVKHDFMTIEPIRYFIWSALGKSTSVNVYPSKIKQRIYLGWNLGSKEDFQVAKFL